MGGNLLAAFFLPKDIWLSMLELNNKVVLITGATGALGSTTAQIFSAVNANLVLTGRDPQKLNKVFQQPTNENHIAKVCDLTNEQEVKQLIQHAIDQKGRIDVLLNIAGGFSMGPLVHELTSNEFNTMFEMNFVSTLNICKAVIPHMITQRSGKIVNISARAACEGKSKMAPYCISKRAVVTLTESLASEHKHNNLNINCILPGTIDTETNRKDMPNADYSTWVLPADIANVMLFLSSELARSVTGAVIPVYGRS